MTVSQDILHPQPRRVVNLKAVGICGVVIVTASLGMQRLHSQQVVKTTAYLKQAADEAVLHREPKEAIQALERYLTFSQGDGAARQKLSELLCDNAADEETLRTAYAMNEAVLLDDNDNTQLRLRQTDLAVRLKIFSDADFHLTILQKTLQDNPRVWHLSGLVAEHEDDTSEAIRCFRLAIENNSSDGETCTRLARLLADEGADSAEVERLFNDLIERHASADAFRATAAWLFTQDRSDEAVAKLWAGLTLSPEDIRLNRMLSAALRLNSNSDSAQQQKQQLRLMQHLETQVKVHQSVIPLRLIFSHVQWDAGRREDAVATLKAGISRNPQAFELQEVLVDYLAHKGDVARAQAAFKRLPRTAIDHARWHFLEGRVLMADQQWSRAAHSFEKASGFSGADAHVRHQSGICLAVCRREQGEREGSIDAWRNTLRADPTSSDSRLGMAAALLESGKMDLAIAEYRQLLEVKGVPELLASLLIRETLSQPRTRQNWQDLEQMLSDDDPIITNKTQRLFLQADLLFAKGYPARALRMLDVAAEDEPKNSRILSARRRLLEDKDGTIMRRMEDTLIGQPDSLEAHITILRLWSCRVGHESSGGWLTQLIAGNVYGQLPEQRRLMVGAQVAEAAAADFERTHEQASAAAMLVEAERVWNRLIEISPNLRAQAVAFIARHRDDESVRVALKQMPTETNSIVQTQCWLAALENTQRKEVLRVSAEQSLRRLVAAEPSNMQLRQAYVEYLIQFAEYKIALTIERQILQREPHNPEALSRCAWILTMVDGDHSEALALSERASRYAPVDTDVRTVRALVLARSSAPAEALPVFGSVPADARTPESFAYEALAWLRSGQQGEALRIVNDVVRQHKPERWRPADQSLLKQILRQAAAAADVVANRRPATELGIAVN